MKSIILPVDFSAASWNAVRYAAEMSCDRQIDRIVLLHAVSVSVYNNVVAGYDGQFMAEEREKAEELLTERSRELVSACKGKVQVQTAMSEMPVLRAVHQLIQDVKADMVLVGVDVADDAVYLSEHVIGLARTSAIPVLVVPRGCRYEQPRKAVLVTRPGQEGQPETMLQPGEGLWVEAWLKREFGVPNLSVYRSGGVDTIKGLLDFTQESGAQLIVALPGRQSLFYWLTHRDLRKAIAQNARYPVLLLK